jgi:hypothetical protein
MKQLREEILPEVLEAARRIESDLASHDLHR